ncbi:TPA: DNA repair protein RadA [Vibrio vulnificus]|uniref:DNA repair protein RadA n=1 Tax=Vibrio vulnificus TaxID=672 RepID=A0A8H9N148_VIBVL|nr:DNA repair protein RadA [Vibrio vulnificus]HAS8540905.1 DNA repair protein RadA [Vibrio vulnificus]
MSKTKSQYLCNECGACFGRWQGQCNACGSWNTISEVKTAPINLKANPSTVLQGKGGYAGVSDKKGHKISEISEKIYKRISTGLEELDLVMGGSGQNTGITIGSVNLISGAPGAGKTTMLTQVIAMLSLEMPVVYATSEENKEQFAARLKRLGCNFNNDNLLVINNDNLDEILEECKEVEAKFAVIDSIQSVYLPSIESAKGGPSQVVGCGTTINQFMKSNKITCFIVGHVTKNNTAAGPQALAHIVDSHIHLDRIESTDTRLLRSNKNRFGSEEAIGLFTMSENGLVCISNPSEYFMSSEDEHGSGTASLCIREGNRSLLVEVQALVDKPLGENVRQIASGISYNRLQILLTILKKHGKEDVYKDVIVSTVGGIKITDTDHSGDLAILAAIVSSLHDFVISQRYAFIGEVTLTGAVKNVPDGVKRVEASIKQGKEQIYVGSQLYAALANKTEVKEKCVEVKHISNLLNAMQKKARRK